MTRKHIMQCNEARQTSKKDAIYKINNGLDDSNSASLNGFRSAL